MRFKVSLAAYCASVFDYTSDGNESISYPRRNESSMSTEERMETQ